MLCGDGALYAKDRILISFFFFFLFNMMLGFGVMLIYVKYAYCSDGVVSSPNFISVSYSESNR